MNQISLESLPNGTALKTTIFWNGLPFTHYGITQWMPDGQVLIHHNSKRFGRAVTTAFSDFTDGNLVFVDSIPATTGDGWLRAERARADVQAGIQWTVGDNCEDLKSRALTGQSGSPTRNAFVGLGLVGLCLFVFSRL